MLCVSGSCFRSVTVVFIEYGGFYLILRGHTCTRPPTREKCVRIWQLLPICKSGFHRVPLCESVAKSHAPPRLAQLGGKRLCAGHLQQARAEPSC
eukprot:6739063-Pyramimonas_sp.AAC.1